VEIEEVTGNEIERCVEKPGNSFEVYGCATGLKEFLWKQSEKIFGEKPGRFLWPPRQCFGAICVEAKKQRRTDFWKWL